MNYLKQKRSIYPLQSFFLKIVLLPSMNLFLGLNNFEPQRLLKVFLKTHNFCFIWIPLFDLNPVLIQFLSMLMKEEINVEQKVDTIREINESEHTNIKT